MAPARRLRLVQPDPPALHGRAAADLRFIRETMEHAGSFTAVPGKGGLVMGAVGCATAAVASMQANSSAWLATWLAGAAVALTVGLVALVLKARAAGTSMLRGVGAKFASSLCPPLAAGALLTFVLVRSNDFELLPGAWLLLYGTGLMTAGAFSARIVPLMGACFIALGAAAFLSPPNWGDAWMALGFGGLQVVFGAIIWSRHGG